MAKKYYDEYSDYYDVWNNPVDVSTLQGQILTRVYQDTIPNDEKRASWNQGQDRIVFVVEDGRQFEMFHCQDCCESVNIKEIVGDLEDLVGTPIIVAEEVSNDGENRSCDHYTWTFYKFRTIKGSVTISWYGESNGYYSEGVDFMEIIPSKQRSLQHETNNN